MAFVEALLAFLLLVANLIGEHGGQPTATPVPTATVAIASPTATVQPLGVEALIASYDWTLEQAMAVATCESGLDPSQVSPTDDWGVFQLHAGIPLDGATYAEHYAKHGYTGWRAYFEALGWGWTPLDAEWNVRAAYHLWEGHGWGLWRCNAGAY